MDKRIAICLIAALMILVVTAAYAPNTGTGTTDDEQVDKEKADAKTLEEKVDTLVENQEKILTELEALKKSQETIGKDVKYVRSKVH